MCSYHLHTLQQRMSHMWYVWSLILHTKEKGIHANPQHNSRHTGFAIGAAYYICLSIHIFFFWWKIIKTQNQISPLIWGYWLSSYANKISVALKQTIGEQICLPSENSSFLLEAHLRKLKKGEEVEPNINTKRQVVYIHFTLHILEGQVHYLYRCYLTSVWRDIRLNLLISML